MDKSEPQPLRLSERIHEALRTLTVSLEPERSGAQLSPAPHGTPRAIDPGDATNVSSLSDPGSGEPPLDVRRDARRGGSRALASPALRGSRAGARARGAQP